MAGVDNCVKRWRTALHAAVAALMLVMLGLAITPAAHAAAATATLSVSHSWQSGFIAHFTVTNSSMAPLNDWKLEFDLPAGESVLHAWNSTVTQTGTHYVLHRWFQGVLSGTYSPPVNCVLNGQYPCT
ncbi:hypothetical protein AN480_13285 [Mycobacterium intracellulare subsp. chimaera]|uniref:cellulose binding domain-containing protein n=1 Tax=Mycobacterium intracellulare TaxID=1767 RepID=UPI00090C388E|nr:cellulose binding domain-containing protein [Mycobacterium intracellulare]APD84129.1 hypothetical protein AN480_13285 [Mycobacterium intracellulare subsp. chimaera]